MTPTQGAHAEKSEISRRLDESQASTSRPSAPSITKRLTSNRALYDLIRERRLHHFGALVQPMLSAHVLGANIELRGLDENRMRAHQAVGADPQ